MKVSARSGFAALLLLAVTAIQCSEVCTVTTTTYYFEPVYTSFADMRASVAPMKPHELTNPGKIYFMDGYLYINEVGKGIHVIDNSDPSEPVAKSFINIPGNYDLAIRNNILYADSYVDLVAIDISTVGEEHEVARSINMFQSYSSMHLYADPVRGVITDLIEVKNVTSNEPECTTAWMPGGWRMYDGFLSAKADSFEAASSLSAPAGNKTGTAGSMARFAAREDHLYALDNANLKVVNISNPLDIRKESDVMIAWDIETIFPLDDKLFIGTQSGMHIFDLANPQSPTKLSTYSHIRSCDPVVVEGDFAYVTLRGGSACGGFSNQLEVIDISNLRSPVLMKTYQMTNPHGLGIDNGILFICDGADGLKVFDATNNMQMKSLAQYKDVQAFDVIPLGNVAMVIGEGGLYQYDYSDVKNIRLLSVLDITPRP